MIANGFIKSSEFISQEKIDKIKEACKKFENIPRLKELKEDLPEEISYGEIKCVLADIENKKVD